MFGTGQEVLWKVRKEWGSPSIGLGWVEGNSRRSERGQGTIGEVRNESGTLSKVRDGLGDTR